jgi:hypothetical protein
MGGGGENRGGIGENLKFSGENCWRKKTIHRNHEFIQKTMISHHEFIPLMRFTRSWYVLIHAFLYEIIAFPMK